MRLRRTGRLVKEWAEDWGGAVFQLQEDKTQCFPFNDAASTRTAVFTRVSGAASLERRTS